MFKFVRKPWAAAACVVLVGCGGVSAMAGKPPFQSQAEKVSNKIAEQLVGAVPYPTDLMRDSLERRQLRERLLRFNKPTKIGYLYLFNLGSREPVGYYVVKGKISSVQSAMTNPDQTWKDDCGADCENIPIVQSIGDDGTWGNNEGGEDGIFFFDSNGVMHESAGLPWHYADAPVEIWTDTPNLTATKKPSSVSPFFGK